MIRRILAADVGSTTTKVVLFGNSGGAWSLLGKMTAPTTVEAPDLDVMIGLRNALSKLEGRTGVTLLEGARLVTPATEGSGVDLFVATSSAGGGLQMLVTGLIKTMTAESAHRAALGAGALVSDVISLDDEKTLVERLTSIKALRPDMILITGGTDGGNISDVAAISEYVAMAEPEPRFGKDFEIPIIFAGNVDARSYVAGVFGEEKEISWVENLRPVLDKENLDPARDEIHRLFLEHVMAHAPGYRTLLAWADGQVEPTPVAVGKALTALAGKRGKDLLGVDIGGATTDMFSVVDGRFYRTVSANLGMSYSMANIIGEAGVENVMRWLPWKSDERGIRNSTFNKMIRPTTLPQTLGDLVTEHALAKEALRLSLDHHRSLVRGLKGVHQRRDVGDVFNQTGTGETLVDLMKVGVIVGSGGVLSYAPRRSQAAMIMLDALQPLGVTDLVVDSQFLLPHVGALLERESAVAEAVLTDQSIVLLGSSVCPVGPVSQMGAVVARVETGAGSWDIIYGDMRLIQLEDAVEADIFPRKDFDVGAGRGIPIKATLQGGAVGLILDGRGRPLVLPKREAERLAALKRWYKELSVYPEPKGVAAASGGDS